MALRSYNYSHEDFADNMHLVNAKPSYDVVNSYTKPNYEYPQHQKNNFNNNNESLSLDIAPIFWFALCLCMLIPLLNSSIINIYNLVNHIRSNIILNHRLEKTENVQIDLNNKLKIAHSQNGLKRTMREEIKVIEANEILIRLI